MKHRHLPATRLALILCAAVLALALTACGSGGDDTSSAVPTTLPTNPPPTLLAVDLKTLLTAEQVSSALGVTVGEPEMYELDTVICYRSEDLRSSVELALQTGTREAYDVTAELYDDAVEAPNLGEVAHWSAQAQTLLVYGKGSILSVAVDKADGSEDDDLVAARQLAALALEALPGA